MFQFVAALFALLMLCLPVNAGSASFTAGTTSITLDTPPVGNYTLNIRFTSLSGALQYGYENLDGNNAFSEATRLSHVTYFKDGNFDVFSDRVELANTTVLEKYDDVLDYAGDSGETYTAVVTKGPTNYVQYARSFGYPTTLSIGRSAGLDPVGAGNYQAFTNTASYGTVDWFWSP